MGKYKSKEKNGKLVVGKNLEKLADENVQLSKDLDHITKEELIVAIKKLAAEIGVEVNFTYENKKHKIGG